MDNTSNNTGSNTNTQRNEELGALWKRKSRSGMTYLAGHVKHDELGKEVTNKVVVFSNDKKTNDKQPDYRIYLSRPMAATEAAADQVESDEELL